MKKVQIFEKFISDRKICDDWEQFLSRDRSTLSRAKILNACGLNRSVLYQNAQIAMQLSKIESDLVLSGLIKTVDVQQISSLADSFSNITELIPMVEEVEHLISLLSTELDVVNNTMLEYPLPR